MTIPENMNMTKRELDAEVLKRFKEHIFNKDFFFKLKLILVDVNRELVMTRGGGGVSYDYMNMKDKSSCDD